MAQLLPIAKRLPQFVASALSWLALATIVATMFVLDQHAPFPGWVALIPVCASAAILAVGPAAGDAGPFVC